jgi:hypothetical protein
LCQFQTNTTNTTGMWQVPIPIWSLGTLVYSVEDDVITAPMQLFYDTLTTAEGATAQMEYASHCPDNTRPSFNNMHSNDFALEQNGWQRKPAGHVVATLCKLNHATTPSCSAANSDSQLVCTHCRLQNPMDATWMLLIILVWSVEVPWCSAFNMKALSIFHTSSTAKYLLDEVLTMSLPKHYGDQSRTLTESS